MQNFSYVLEAALTPVALISGIGLLLLSMVNRYNHAIDRIRELLKEKSVRAAGDQSKVDRSISVIYSRCKLMRNAILCVSSSIVLSGAMVLATAVEGLFGVQLYILKALLLVV